MLRILGCIPLVALLAACSGAPSATGRAVGASDPSYRVIRQRTGQTATPRVSLIGKRSEFSRGACVAYSTGSSASPTVFVDAGHGGLDTGATSTFNGALIAEKTLTLAVARDLLVDLERLGFRVVLARTGDTPVVRLSPAYADSSGFTELGERADAEARIDCANAAHAQVLLSIHFDAFDDPTVDGAETIYDDARSFTAQNRRLATLVQTALVSAFNRAGWQVADRGVQADSMAGTPALTQQGAAYGHLLELGPPVPGWLPRASAMPGVLVEPLFVSNSADAGIAISKRGQRVMAQALAAAVKRYLATAARHTREKR